jgi:predicted outer membrane repeat protein
MKKLMILLAILSCFVNSAIAEPHDDFVFNGNLTIKNGGAINFPDGSIQSSATAQGPKGDKGDTGLQGIQGPKGDAGATGPQGPAGQITLATICAAISAENAQLPSFCFSSSYFPLQVGNKWVYTSLVPGNYRNDEIIGSEIVNGITTYIRDRLEPSPDNYYEKMWLAYDSSSLLMFRIWGNEGADPAIDFMPPAVQLKISPQVGDQWSWSGTMGTATFKQKIEVLSINDTVTVPAGTFYNCIKI